MADMTQVKRLINGVPEWNQWRRKKSQIRIDLRKADLRGNILHEIDLREADLRGANLSRAVLSAAHLSRANLRDADLSLANLGQVHLSEAFLDGTLLNGADLHQSVLHSANLMGADLSGANLSGADLKFANLSGANLTESDLTAVRLGYTSLDDVDLSRVKGLETVHHGAPSTIGIDTLYKSKGHIPEVFLRGCGVPENLLLFMRSLTRNAFNFYSCFISYATQDSPFVEQLYADLQSRGVRCWFAPADLKIGDPFRKRIDEAIRTYDKLMIVLSAHSLQSDWVEKEVETAMEKERQQKRTMLFPVRLDDTVMQTTQAWAADIRRTRQIGDMSQWQDPVYYHRALTRLLHDLQAV